MLLALLWSKSGQAFCFERNDIEASIGSIFVQQDTTERATQDSSKTRIQTTQQALRYGYQDIKSAEKLRLDVSAQQYLTLSHRDIYTQGTLNGTYLLDTETRKSSASVDVSTRRWREGPSAVDTLPAAESGDFVFQNEANLGATTTASITPLWRVGVRGLLDSRRGFSAGDDSSITSFLEHDLSPVSSIRIQASVGLYRDELYTSTGDEETLVWEVKLTPLDSWDLHLGRGAQHGDDLVGRSQFIAESNLKHRERIWEISARCGRGLYQSYDKKAYMWGQIYESKLSVDVTKAAAVSVKGSLNRDDDYNEQAAVKTTRREIEVRGEWMFGDLIDHETRLRENRLGIVLLNLDVEATQTKTKLQSLSAQYSRIF